MLAHFLQKEDTCIVKMTLKPVRGIYENRVDDYRPGEDACELVFSLMSTPMERHWMWS